ncbi:nucleotidyltransferase family protein [Caldithrix abyssi]|uniref:Molybdenum cofactor cytidylyltransferase n=1 Tax=Caldithrix abyssi DSM 13497 TaxID=880073 RepID=H1XWF6_CALAY|nr:nucleotidyltransferase family protein [Caldithrix abyssi]APF20773.1 molybdenum cofactor cytidylyltransferase [Caldithrix abyssi DSM 13497]EHO40738.1 hypothetical protein Calab_1110 [Caldithrix abyssi DSM 13497]
MADDFSQWSAVILAAGRSQRFGAPKALQSFNGVPFVTRIRKNLEERGIQEMVLVLGFQAQNLIPHIPDVGYFKIAVNSNFDLGQFSSLQVGLQQVHPQAKGIVMCLVDQPHVASTTYLRLLESARRFPRAFLLPRFANRGGHPVIIPAVFFKEIIQADARQVTLREIMLKHAKDIRRVAVDDPAVLEDIDTRETLLELEKKYR